MTELGSSSRVACGEIAMKRPVVGRVPPPTRTAAVMSDGIDEHDVLGVEASRYLGAR